MGIKFRFSFSFYSNTQGRYTHKHPEVMSEKQIDLKIIDIVSLDVIG